MSQVYVSYTQVQRVSQTVSLEYCDFSTQDSLYFLHPTYGEWASISNGVGNDYIILMRNSPRC